MSWRRCCTRRARPTCRPARGRCSRNCARAEASGKVASCDVGFAGRLEKLTLLVIGLALQRFFPQFGLLQWAVIVVGVLSHITALQRLLYARRIMLGDEGSPRLRKRQGIV